MPKGITITVDNQILLQQIKQLSENGLIPDQSEAEEWWGRRLIDFDLEYTSTPPKQFDHLINQITNEIENNENRKRARSDSNKKDLRRCVRAIVLNFAYMPHMIKACDKVYLVVSLSKFSFGDGNDKLFEGVKYPQFKAAYDVLMSDRLGYLHIHQLPYKGRRRTSIGATEKLQKLIQGIQDQCVKITFHPSKSGLLKNRVFLRDKEKKNIAYKDTVNNKRIKTNLERINRLLCGTDINLKLPANLHDDFIKHLENRDINYIDQTRVLLKRVFNLERFDLGGRFYNGWWQGIPEDYRSYININGQNVIELDYSEMHPTMVYAEAKIPKPENSYLPIAKMTEKLGEKIARDWGKLVFNMLLNADTRYPYQPKEYKLIQKETGIKWRELLDAMCEHHAPIKEHYFGTGIGRHLQYIDSQIAEAVLLHFTNIEVPCLPIHDSFIVPAGYKEELYGVMNRYAKEITGIDITIKGKGGGAPLPH